MAAGVLALARWREEEAVVCEVNKKTMPTSDEDEDNKNDDDRRRV